MKRKKEGESPQKVIRSIVVSISDCREIFESLQAGEVPNILRFYIGEKGDGEEKRYTFLGGKVYEGEKIKEAIQREITEETNSTFLGIPYQTIIGEWCYSSPKSGERLVFLTYNPAIPSDEVVTEDPRMRGIIAVNIDQLGQLIERGSLDGIPIEGHLTTIDAEDIEIDKENKERRNIAMRKGLDWMRHIENYLRRRFEGLKGLSEEEFVKEYQKILSEFMRRGLEVGLKQKKVSPEVNGQRHELVQVLTSGFLGKDILYYLPQLSKHGLDWDGLEKSSEGTKVFVRFLHECFAKFLSENNLDLTQFAELLKDTNVSLGDRIKLINSLDIFFRKILKEVFQVDDDDLDKALFYIQNFFRDLSNEMKVADPNLTSVLYQEFTLVNEVNNANFGYLLSLFLGFDFKTNLLEQEQLMRFEAGRHLLLLFKALTGLRYYENEIRKIRNGQLQHILNNFFGPIIDGQTIKLDQSCSFKIRIRGDGEKRYIVDEKPTKSFTSFLRKSFEEEIERISDFYSVSIVFLDLNQDQFSLNIYYELISDIVRYLKEQTDLATVDITELKTYGSENFIKGADSNIDGKRKGSQSGRMVRCKVVISIANNKGEKESLELTIYPFISLNNENGYWGFQEKIVDDKDYPIRRLLASENGIPSFYHLLFPPKFYKRNYGGILNSRYHRGSYSNN